ncbi:MAG: nuclear transport factor 2 family protein [Cyanobacteria bacterium P01_B01_bin.77]
MKRTTLPLMLAGLFLVGFNTPANAEIPLGTSEIQEIPEIQMDQTQQTLQIAEAFLTAAGSGDMDTLSELMADDFIWHNEGDTSVPWIGTWEGKETVLNQFLPAFGTGLTVTSWTTDYSFAKDDQAVFMGTMTAEATNTGESTGPMSWAVRVQVVDGEVKSWNWFEDSFAVSRAFNGQ